MSDSGIRRLAMCPTCGSQFRNRAARDRHCKTCVSPDKKWSDLDVAVEAEPATLSPEPVTTKHAISTELQLEKHVANAGDKGTIIETVFQGSECAEAHLPLTSVKHHQKALSSTPETTILEVKSKSLLVDQLSICEDCGLEFKSQSATARHKKKCVSGSQSLKLPGINAEPLEKLVTDTPKKDCDTTVVCADCGSEFKSQSACDRHKRKCISSSNPSNISDANVDSPAAGNSHPVECPTCGLTFQSLAAFTKHQRKCVSSSESTTHVQSPKGVAIIRLTAVKTGADQAVTCCSCGLKFKSQSVCNRHRRKCLSNVQNLKISNLESSKELGVENPDLQTVWTCTEIRLSPEPLPVRVTTPMVDSPSNKHAICSNCGLTFSGLVAYQKHQKICESPKMSEADPKQSVALVTLAAKDNHQPIACTGCGSQFTSNKVYKRHVKTCADICTSKVEPPAEVIKAHLDGTNNRSIKDPIICNYCGLQFKDPTRCASHQKCCIHGPNPENRSTLSYSCCGCLKSFTYKASYSNHKLLCAKYKSFGSSEEKKAKGQLRGTSNNVSNLKIIEVCNDRKKVLVAEPDLKVKVDVPIVAITSLENDTQASDDLEDDALSEDIPEDVPLAMMMGKNFKKTFKCLKISRENNRKPLKRLRKSPIASEKTKVVIRKSLRVPIVRISLSNDKSDSEENMPELEVQEPIPHLPVVSPAKSNSDLSDIPILSPISDLPLPTENDRAVEGSDAVSQAKQGAGLASDSVLPTSPLPLLPESDKPRDDSETSLKSKQKIVSAVDSLSPVSNLLTVTESDKPRGDSGTSLNSKRKTGSTVGGLYPSSNLLISVTESDKPRDDSGTSRYSKRKTGSTVESRCNLLTSVTESDKPADDSGVPLASRRVTESAVDSLSLISNLPILVAESDNSREDNSMTLKPKRKAGSAMESITIVPVLADKSRDDSGTCSKPKQKTEPAINTALPLCDVSPVMNILHKNVPKPVSVTVIDLEANPRSKPEEPTPPSNVSTSILMNILSQKRTKSTESREMFTPMQTFPRLTSLLTGECPLREPSPLLTCLPISALHRTQEQGNVLPFVEDKTIPKQFPLNIPYPLPSVCITPAVAKPIPSEPEEDLDEILKKNVIDVELVRYTANEKLKLQEIEAKLPFQDAKTDPEIEVKIKSLLKKHASKFEKKIAVKTKNIQKKKKSSKNCAMPQDAECVTTDQDVFPSISTLSTDRQDLVQPAASNLHVTKLKIKLKHPKKHSSIIENLVNAESTAEGTEREKSSKLICSSDQTAKPNRQSRRQKNSRQFSTEGDGLKVNLECDIEGVTPEAEQALITDSKQKSCSPNPCLEVLGGATTESSGAEMPSSESDIEVLAEIYKLDDAEQSIQGKPLPLDRAHLDSIAASLNSKHLETVAKPLKLNSDRPNSIEKLPKLVAPSLKTKVKLSTLGIGFLDAVVKVSTVGGATLKRVDKPLPLTVPHQETIVKSAKLDSPHVKTLVKPLKFDLVHLNIIGDVSKLDSTDPKTTIKLPTCHSSQVVPSSKPFACTTKTIILGSPIKQHPYIDSQKLKESSVSLDHSFKLKTSAFPKCFQDSEPKEIVPRKQKSVFEAFTYSKNTKPSLTEDSKQLELSENDSSSKLTSPAEVRDQSTRSIDMNTFSEASTSFSDMFTNIKFKSRAAQSARGKAVMWHTLNGDEGRHSMFEDTSADLTSLKKSPRKIPKKNLQNKNRASSPAISEDCSEDVVVNLDLDAVPSGLKPDTEESIASGKGTSKSDLMDNLVIGASDKLKEVPTNAKPRQEAINVSRTSQHLEFRRSKVVQRGRPKQKVVAREPKRLRSPSKRRTSLRSPLARNRSRSPIRRREGSVRRTRCFLSYEEMYTSDVASEASSVDSKDSVHFSVVDNVKSLQKTTKPILTPKNQPLSKLRNQKLKTPILPIDNDPQPKIMIVEKFTYTKGPITSDYKPIPEKVDGEIIKEHVVKDLSNPNRFRSEGSEVVPDSKCVSIIVAADTNSPAPKENLGSNTPTEEKKPKKRNHSLDTAYYCHICSKHYYSNYNLNKHKESTLHKFNVENVESNKSTVETNEPSLAVEETITQVRKQSEPAVNLENALSEISLPKNNSTLSANIETALHDLDSNFSKTDMYPLQSNEVVINHAFGNYESVSYWLEQQTTHQNNYDWSENDVSNNVDSLDWSSESLPSKLVDTVMRDSRDPMKLEHSNMWGDNRTECGQNSLKSENVGTILDAVSLKDLQMAMGATDEEMIMLQHLGGSNMSSEWPLQEVQLIDLDNQKAITGVGKARGNGSLQSDERETRGENDPLAERVPDGMQMNPNECVVAEGLKSHMTSALGGLIERALKNIHKPGGKHKNSSLNKRTLELLQKLSKLYSDKTGKTLDGAHKLASVRDPGGHRNSMDNAAKKRKMPDDSDANVRQMDPSGAFGDPEPKYACPICGVRFERKISINYHIAKAHKTMAKGGKHGKAKTITATKIASDNVRRSTQTEISLKKMKEPKSQNSESSAHEGPWRSDKHLNVENIQTDVQSSNRSPSSNASSSVRMVSNTIGFEKGILSRDPGPAIFTDDDVDYESPLEMLANQCFVIANRGLENSEDSKMSSLDASDVQIAKFVNAKKNTATGEREDKGRGKTKDKLSNYDGKNLEITKTKSKILQSVYLPSRKKAKVLESEDVRPDGARREAAEVIYDETKEKHIQSRKHATSVGIMSQTAGNNMTYSDSNKHKKVISNSREFKPSIKLMSVEKINTKAMKLAASSMTTTYASSTPSSDDTRGKDKRSKIHEIGTESEDDIRLKAEAALRDLNKGSRLYQKLHWNLHKLPFKKSNYKHRKKLGDQSCKKKKVDTPQAEVVDSKDFIPVTFENSAKLLTEVTSLSPSKSDNMKAKPYEQLEDVSEDKPNISPDEKLAVDVYEFEDDEISTPDLDFSFRHQNGLCPKLNTTPLKGPYELDKQLKVKHKNDQSDLGLVTSSRETVKKGKKKVSKINSKKRALAKPKKQVSHSYNQNFDLEGNSNSVQSNEDAYSQSTYSKHTEKLPNIKVNNTSTFNGSAAFDELIQNVSKVKKDTEESLPIATKTPTSQVSSTVKTKSPKSKAKSVPADAVPPETVNKDAKPENVEPENVQTSEDVPKTRRGRNHVCYTEIYDDMFSDMEEYDFSNFDEEPARKKTKKVAPKGKNKNDILSCVFGKGRRNSSITIGSDMSDTDRECIAKTKFDDNDWDSGEVS